MEQKFATMSSLKLSARPINACTRGVCLTFLAPLHPPAAEAAGNAMCSPSPCTQARRRGTFQSADYDVKRLSSRCLACFWTREGTRDSDSLVFAK